MPVFTPTPLAGVFVVEPVPASDERGWFARVFDADMFAARGLASVPVQHNLSHSRVRHTLRGLHYQRPPYGEAKLVSCIAGEVFDVVVDLRAGSPTRCQWFAVELSADNLKQLYVPEGCAHGFLTLSADARVGYQMFARYHAPAASGVRWDDPAFGIAWPHAPVVISARDAGYQLLG